MHHAWGEEKVCSSEGCTDQVQRGGLCKSARGMEMEQKSNCDLSREVMRIVHQAWKMRSGFVSGKCKIIKVVL